MGFKTSYQKQMGDVRDCPHIHFMVFPFTQIDHMFSQSLAVLSNKDKNTQK